MPLDPMKTFRDHLHLKIQAPCSTYFPPFKPFNSIQTVRDPHHVQYQDPAYVFATFDAFELNANLRYPDHVEIQDPPWDRKCLIYEPRPTKVQGEQTIICLDIDGRVHGSFNGWLLEIPSAHGVTQVF